MAAGRRADEQLVASVFRVLAVEVAIAVIVATCLAWAVLVVLARRLPPGLLRDFVGLLPACASTVRTLRRDPRVPRRVKVMVALAAVWIISPIDLIPEFVPIIGPLDDIVVVVLTLRYASRRIHRQVLTEAWTGEPAMLTRLLGDERRRSGPGAR